MDKKIYVEQCLDNFGIEEFEYDEANNQFCALLFTGSVYMPVNICLLEEEDCIRFEAMAGLRIPEEKYWEVLDYINDRLGREYWMPYFSLNIDESGENFYLCAKCPLYIDDQTSSDAFGVIYGQLLAMIDYYAPNVLRIILGMDTIETQEGNFSINHFKVNIVRN